MLLVTTFATSSAAAPQAESVPEACLFSTPEAMQKLERDDPSLYGLSPESTNFNSGYQRDMEEVAKQDPPFQKDEPEGLAAPEPPERPVPEGAVIWSNMALTPTDADRLETMSTIYRENVERVSEEVEGVVGDAFVGITWSYLDGFVVSVTEGKDVADQLTSRFSGVPIKVHEGLVPRATTDANLKALADLSHDGFIASSDASCGITFVAFAEEPLSTKRLDELLAPGTYQVVDLDYFGGAIPIPSAGKAERKQTLSGGLKIWTNGGTTSNWCTSNVVARKDPSEQWLITAGHCTQGMTISGSANNVSVLSGSNWYQGLNTNSTNRISLGSTTYHLFGGNHDIQVIQLSGGRTPSQLMHETSYQAYPGSPWYDAYVDPTWWYWNLGFEHTGIRVCQSGYTMGGPDCGMIQSTTNSYGVSAPLWPYNATMTNIRSSVAMESCRGDSGGSVWADNQDDNIAGIVHGQGATEYHRVREGRRIACGNAFWTGISSLQNIGLTAPWGM